MAESYDKETQAIGAVLNALGPLDPKARKAVLDYVAKRLEIVPPETGKPPVNPPSDQTPPGESQETRGAANDECHISALVEEKQPRTAIEMAALVAYYLSHKSPKEERKQTVSTDDLITYFKIAGFKLPKAPQATLPNAKTAGYVDLVGGGEYKLNPVGYNLIVHSLPKGPKTTTQKRPAKKKAAKAKRAESRQPKSKATKS